VHQFQRANLEAVVRDALNDIADIARADSVGFDNAKSHFGRICHEFSLPMY
jgi:hypothetical protein